MHALREVIGRRDGPPLIVVTGPTGVGRTSLLAALREELAASGWHTATMRFDPASAVLPESSPSRVFGCPTSSWPVPVTVTGAYDDPAIAAGAAVALAAPLRTADRAVLLIDDVQWMDRDFMAVLEQLAHTLAGSTAKCVCAVRVPAPGPTDELATTGRTILRRLRGAGLVHDVRLRGLRDDEIAGELARTLRHIPDPALVSHIATSSRGLRAAVHDAVEELEQSGTIRFASGHAYLTGGDWPTGATRYRRLNAVMLELGPDDWSAAKAVAVLHPLGTAVPRLLAKALACPEVEAEERLVRLCRAGVLHRGRRGASWRFPVPLVAIALRASLGPYERQHLAAIAVTALWSGTAYCDDPHYRADRIAEAGRLVDPRRSRTELLAHAKATMTDDPGAAGRWLRAAAENAENLAQYASILLDRAIACYLAADSEGCLRVSTSLLEQYPEYLPAEAIHRAHLLRLLSQHAVGDSEAVRTIAERRRTPSDEGPDPVSAATALVLLDRWDEARELLATTTGHRRAESGALLRDYLLAVCEFWTGRRRDFTHSLYDDEGGPYPPHTWWWSRMVNAHTTVLLTVGNLSGAEKTLACANLSGDQLDPSEQAHLAALRGHADVAVALGRQCLATPPLHGGGLGRAPMAQAVATLLVSRGRITDAGELLANVRSAGTPLAHLLDYAEALVDHALGKPDEATRRLRRALSGGRERGLLVGADLCWSQLAELALERGDREEAGRCLTEIERVATAMPTGRAATHALLVRATVNGDQEAAAACLRLGRERGQPFELATVITRLVRHGVGDPKRLSEAYDLFGKLGATLERAWLRNLMREHEIPVPGRRQTVAENERLLGRLVAEGLSNKQVARTLRTSTKSVEGKLSRLFTRTGLTSRIELAKALLTEGYPD
ncbi:ATP-binding protein [Saccharomonospora glauca]|uniref:Response regulator containing a CheY-like receiver domain and an HTH DNA-binding domain n=1 Tax=Saccharomonospora glauca K62 TaxID=928724 RepID=I1D2Z4_9PSEU|nr:AAA family ATPase [Saccharomonospora glauca]EIE99318.1 response regulator containing a CheY-like receiver domain and an HTH DNA-binding domain [Saccharomonospora glauca K62]